jgi:hypothetical protein
MVPDTGRQSYVFTPSQARACEVKRRSSRRQDLVFATERARGATVEIGILGAEDWRGAEQALRTALGWLGSGSESLESKP